MIESLTAALERFGRYFSAVTFLPSFLLVAYIWILISGGALTDSFSVSQVIQSVGEVEFKTVATGILLGVLVGLLTHPLQLPLVQILEGYWGPSHLATTAAARRIRAHRLCRDELEEIGIAASEEWRRSAWSRVSDQDKEKAVLGCDSDQGKKLISDATNMRFNLADVSAQTTEMALSKALIDYPEGRRIMPTRLGNILRAGEDVAGSQYSLDGVTIAAYVSLVAEPSHAKAMSGEAESLDLSARLCVTLLMSVVLTEILLLRHGLWLLLGLFPLFLAYLAYRAALASARSYMLSLRIIIDLNRFRLYEAMRIPLPSSHPEELERGSLLMDMLNAKETPLTYVSSGRDIPDPGAKEPRWPFFKRTARHVESDR